MKTDGYANHIGGGEFLIRARTNSILFNPDTLFEGIENMNRAEEMHPDHFGMMSREALAAHRDHVLEFDDDFLV